MWSKPSKFWIKSQTSQTIKINLFAIQAIKIVSNVFVHTLFSLIAKTPPSYGLHSVMYIISV